MIVCYRREHALDAGAHLDINAHCFFEVDGLVFLRPFSVFFGGARDGCCGVATILELGLKATAWHGNTSLFFSGENIQSLQV